MKTRVTIMIEHDKPIEGLGAKIAARAWTMQGVNKAELQSTQPTVIAYAVYDKINGGSKSLHWAEQHDPDGDGDQYQVIPLTAVEPSE